jgi:hypothetical protein
VITPALRTGLVRGSWRDRCSAMLSAPSAEFGADVGVARVGDIVGAGDSNSRSHGWPNRVG